MIHDSDLYAQGTKVNLIMTDYCMPGMSGYDLLRRVKVKPLNQPSAISLSLALSLLLAQLFEFEKEMCNCQ